MIVLVCSWSLQYILILFRLRKKKKLENRIYILQPFASMRFSTEYKTAGRTPWVIKQQHMIVFENNVILWIQWCKFITTKLQYERQIIERIYHNSDELIFKRVIRDAQDIHTSSLEHCKSEIWKMKPNIFQKISIAETISSIPYGHSVFNNLIPHCSQYLRLLKKIL